MLLDKHVAFISSLFGWKLQNFDLYWLFSDLSDGGSEKYFEFGILLRSPDKSIMPKIAETNGWINIYGKPVKFRFKTFSFFEYLQKLIENFASVRKIFRC